SFGLIVYLPFPPPLTVVEIAVGLLKQVGIATATYFEPLPDCVTRRRRVAATPFWRIGVGISFPAASRQVSAAVVPDPAPLTRTLGISFASALPVPAALFVQTSKSH